MPRTAKQNAAADKLFDAETGMLKPPPVGRMTLHKANRPPPPNHVAEIRRYRGLSQKQLAASVGIRVADLAKIERGEARLTGLLPVHLSRALDVDPQNLGGEDAVAYAVTFGFATCEAQIVQHAQALNQFMEWLGAPTARLIAAAENVVRLWPADPNRGWAKASPELVAAVDELAASVNATRGIH